jgi:hypothetical protein
MSTTLLEGQLTCRESDGHAQAHDAAGRPCLLDLRVNDQPLLETSRCGVQRSLLGLFLPRSCTNGTAVETRPVILVGVTSGTIALSMSCATVSVDYEASTVICKRPGITPCAIKPAATCTIGKRPIERLSVTTAPGTTGTTRLEDQKQC